MGLPFWRILTMIEWGLLDLDKEADETDEEMLRETLLLVLPTMLLLFAIEEGIEELWGDAEMCDEEAGDTYGENKEAVDDDNDDDDDDIDDGDKITHSIEQPNIWPGTTTREKISNSWKWD